MAIKIAKNKDFQLIDSKNKQRYDDRKNNLNNNLKNLLQGKLELIIYDNKLVYNFN
jgi:hypothetical protein